MSDDLVSRLSETLDEAERVALGASPLGADMDPHWKAVQVEERVPGGMLTPMRFWMVVTRNREQTVARCHGDIKPRSSTHITRWDPQAVLRLVAAHRKIIAEHQARVPDFRRIGDDGELMPPSEPVCSVCIHGLRRVPAPCPTILSLAEGWGITEEGR